MALKPKDQKFLDLYFENGFNATQAIIDACGPFNSREYARVAASRLLQRQDVRDEMERRLIEWRAKRQLTVEQVGQQLQDALRVDIADFYDPETGLMKPLCDIPPHARRQISSIEMETITVLEVHSIDEEYEDPITDELKFRRVTKPIPVTKIVPKIKLWDRRRAEELWGKWKKMYTDKVEHAGEGGGPVRVAFSINGITKGQDT